MVPAELNRPIIVVDGIVANGNGGCRGGKQGWAQHETRVLRQRSCKVFGGVSDSYRSLSAAASFLNSLRTTMKEMAVKIKSG